MTLSTFASPGVSLQGGGGSGGGTPGGSTTQIQYNNAGSFGGATGLTTDGTNLTLGSASQLLWSTDLIFTRRGAANLRFGAADAAAPVAQTLSVQSVVAGTANTAGTNLTITGSQGTGTGAGGSIVFQVAPPGGAGTAQNALQTLLTMQSNGLVTFNATTTIAVIAPIYNASTAFQLTSNTATINFGSGADTVLGREAAGVTAVRGANSTTGGALGFIEQTAPAAPAANGVRIYAVDNGSGKTQLMALFATGAAQQIAIEP